LERCHLDNEMDLLFPMRPGWNRTEQV
jgi:hypothetical protein